MSETNYERKISAKVEARIADLAQRLYDFMPNVCWMTENNLAAALKTNTWQIRNAKAYLLKSGQIQMEFRQNGKRRNPIHTLIKSSPINLNSTDEVEDGKNININWSLLNSLSVDDFNNLSVEDKLEFYEELRLPFIPLHFPKFKSNGKVLCSCRYGQYCSSIGKHPATAYKSLDFSGNQTFKAMKSYWQKDARYNIGFIVDGFTVIDVDFRKGGAYSLELLQDIYGELSKNLMVKTGNGFHIYGLGSLRLKNSVDILGFPGIDVRSNGSFIVAPFSDHFTGGQYEWLSLAEPGPLPQSFVNDLRELEIQSYDFASSDKNINAGTTLPKYLDKDCYIPKGERNWTLFRNASRERGKGLDQSEIYAFLEKINAKCCKEPLDKREILNISKSVMKFQPNFEKYRLSSQNVIT